jgi:hypothetical protein
VGTPAAVSSGAGQVIPAAFAASDVPTTSAVLNNGRMGSMPDSANERDALLLLLGGDDHRLVATDDAFAALVIDGDPYGPTNPPAIAVVASRDNSSAFDRVGTARRT